MEIAAMMRNETMLDKTEPAYKAPKPLSAPNELDEALLKDYPGLAKPWLTDAGYEKLTNMSEYITAKEGSASLDLYMLNLKYESFKDDLRKANPELAAKNFSFSFDGTGSIIILDPNNSLSRADKFWLGQNLSLHQGFGEIISELMDTVKFLTVHTHKKDNQAPASTHDTEAMDYGSMLRNNKIEDVIQDLIAQHLALPPSISEEA